MKRVNLFIIAQNPISPVEVGHNAVFEGPDDKDWICCHYWLQGKTIVAFDHLPLYAETREQLGIEPLHFENGKWSVNEPFWTEQKVIWNTK